MHLLLLFLPYPVVDISFLQETYTVNEDSGLALVCIQEDPTIQFEREVTVTVATRNGIAQGILRI